MYLDLAHTKLDAYVLARKLVVECYALSKTFPPEERFGLTQQIRKAATSVSMNIAEGSARRTLADRRRFFEISRSSTVEIDSILDNCFDLGYCAKVEMDRVGECIIRCFQTLTGLLKAE